MTIAILVLLLRLLLAGVLAGAAAAKLADRPAVREMLVGFGLPRRAAVPGAALLPAAELAVASALLPTSLAPYGSLAALALLVAFTGAVAAQLARGRRPPCNCFGAVHAKPIGPATLVRNGALIGLAAFVVAVGWSDPGPSAIAWLRNPLLATIGVLALVSVTQAALFVVLLRRHGHALARLEALDEGVDEEAPAGLPVGAAAPEFTLPDLEDTPVTLASLRAEGKPVLLLFSDPACGPCSALLPEVGRWQQERAGELVVALVSSGSLEDNRARASEHDLTIVLRQEDHQLALAYGAAGTPMAVLIDRDGSVASEVAAGADAVAALVAQAVDSPSEVIVGVQ